MSDTLETLFAPHPDDAPAIGAPDRPWLTFGGLRTLVGATRVALAAAGVGRGDRVAIVLPNGPEMAAAFVTIAQSSTTAPLNPAYRAEEIDFYLGDLGAKAIVLPADYAGPALEAAGRRGLTVLRLDVDPAGPAGTFVLTAEGAAEAGNAAAAGPDDVALILHTSGTTSRPKIVPLLQRNLAASARHIGTALDLAPTDRCLNVIRCFTSTDCWRRCRPASPPAGRSGARRASTRCASSAGSRRPGRRGIRRCRRCTRRSWRGRHAMRRSSRERVCG